MQNEWHFELNLNFMSLLERDRNIDFYHSDYLQNVLYMLAHAKQHLFEENLLHKCPGKTLEEIRDAHPFLIPFGKHQPNPHQEGKLCPVYYDVHMRMNITPDHLFYDFFVATHLQHADLMEIDSLLELGMGHIDNYGSFARFLHLVIRKYQDWVLQEESILTIREWIDAKEKQLLKEDQFWDFKFKSRRAPNSTETVLNQTQIVLLICYMQKAKFFLNEKSLSATDAAKCFEVLTAYSFNTLRQDMAKYLNLLDEENFVKLEEALLGMIELIRNDFKKNSKPTRLLT